MVTPLDIKAVLCHQGIHHLMRIGASVENITDNMQMIDGAFFYHFGQLDDE